MYIRSSMALAISNIPILTGAAAETFVKNAEAAERSRGSKMAFLESSMGEAGSYISGCVDWPLGCQFCIQEKAC